MSDITENVGITGNNLPSKDKKNNSKTLKHICKVEIAWKSIISYKIPR